MAAVIIFLAIAGFLSYGYLSFRKELDRDSGPIGPGPYLDSTSSDSSSSSWFDFMPWFGGSDGHNHDSSHSDASDAGHDGGFFDGGGSSDFGGGSDGGGGCDSGGGGGDGCG